jgi:hypothetical protein
MAFDFKAQKWSAFTPTQFGLWCPSPDGKYLYTDGVPTASGDAQVVRLRLADRKMEAVRSLKGVRRVADDQIAGLIAPTWVGATPDGSIFITREAGTQEIYALSLKWP